MIASIEARPDRSRNVLAGIVLLYLATRLALLWRFPPHVDEAVFATWTYRASQHLSESFLPLTKGQQPLLEWVALPFVWLGARPLIAVRLVSLGAGLVTLLLVWHLGRRLGGRAVAIAAAALFVVLPFFLVYTVMGLYDPLATAFVTAAVVLQLRLAERPRLGVALLLGIAIGAGLLTKLTAEISLALLPLGAFAVDWRAPRLRRRLAAWAGLVGVALVAAWGVYQVLRLSDYFGRLPAERRAYLARHSVSTFLDHPAHWLHVNGSSYGSALLGYTTVPVLVACAVGVVIALRERSRLLPLLACWGGVPIAVTIALADIPYVRWLDVAMPPLVLLAAFGAVRLRQLVARRLRWPIPLAVAAALLVPAVAWDATTLEHPLSRPYPAKDDFDYVRDASAGGPWLELVPELERLAGGSPLQVAYSGLEVEYVKLALVHDRSISLVEADSSPGSAPLYGFENGSTLADLHDGLGWQRILTLPRPRKGVPVVLYRRGVPVKGRFAASPAALRRLLGPARARRFVAAHRDVARWEGAWRLVHSGGT